jgi:hypothetical protein
MIILKKINNMHRTITRWEIITWLVAGYDKRDAEMAHGLFARKLTDEYLAKQFKLIILRKGTFAY